MNENPFEKDYSDTPENPIDNTPNNNENFVNPYAESVEEEAVFTSENIDFDDSPVVEDVEDVVEVEEAAVEYVPAQSFETPEAEETPAVSEYTYPYTAPVVNQSAAQTDSQPNADVGSYEWYGNIPYNNTQPANYPVQTPQQNTASAVPSRDKRTSLAVIILVCMIVSVLFGSGSAILVNHYLSNDTKTETSVVVNNEEDKGNNTITNIAPLTDEITTTDIVDLYADSVVEIITEYVQTGVFSQQYIQSGAGSGVIIDAKAGYIVTNHHVIEGAQRISVTLRDGTTLQAQLVGSDSKMDIALLKVEHEGLKSAIIGNSDNLKVGQRTIAIGNPLGQLGGTVTEGIISALDRDVTVDGQTMNLLQTDTAINPGNSGGGLFDGNGNLIGIVVAKSSGSEVEGLGFAIPINDAVDVISDLIDYGYVRGRVSIGMEFLDVTAEPVAWMYGLSDLGCYVYSVESGSNASTAGFKSGDLIVSVDGVEVDTSDEVEAQLDKKNVGDTVEFVIKRGRNTGKLSLVLEEYVPENLRDDNDFFFQWDD